METIVLIPIRMNKRIYSQQDVMNYRIKTQAGH